MPQISPAARADGAWRITLNATGAPISDIDPSSQDIGRLDALDAGLGHVVPGRGERSLRVDAAAGVLDHIGFESGLARIDRAPGDTEIGRKAGEENLLDVARLQIGGETRGGLAVRFGKGRV